MWVVRCCFDLTMSQSKLCASTYLQSSNNKYISRHSIYLAANNNLFSLHLNLYNFIISNLPFSNEFAQTIIPPNHHKALGMNQTRNYDSAQTTIPPIAIRHWG